MSLFNKKKRDIPNLNTAALPDLIFTVLFFFMIVTQLRDTEVKVQHTVPKTIEQTKLGKKTAKVHIYVGRHSDNPAEMSIQLGNRMGTIADIAPFIEAERSDMAPEDKDMLTVYLPMKWRSSKRIFTDFSVKKKTNLLIRLSLQRVLIMN